MKSHEYRPGDWVVFRKTKFSNCPGPRAENISAAEHGDSYAYTVDKFWVVEEVQGDQVTLRTRRGKRHTFSTSHPNLHKATWLERWWYKSRFEAVVETASLINTPVSKLRELVNPNSTGLHERAG